MVRVDGLREKVERALLHGGHGVLDAAVGRHDDDGDVGIDLLRRAEHSEPVAFGKAKIGQHQGRLVLLHQPNRLRLIARLEHSMARALESMPQHGPQRVFVFDDEDLGGCGHSDEGQRSQPGGTLSLRASSSMSPIFFFRSTMSVLTRSSSAIAFCRSSPIRAR